MSTFSLVTTSSFATTPLWVARWSRPCWSWLVLFPSHYFEWLSNILIGHDSFFFQTTTLSRRTLNESISVTNQTWEFIPKTIYLVYIPHCNIRLILFALGQARTDLFLDHLKRPQAKLGWDMNYIHLSTFLWLLIWDGFVLNKKISYRQRGLEIWWKLKWSSHITITIYFS